MEIKRDVIGSPMAEKEKTSALFTVHHLVRDVLECVGSFKPMDLFSYIKEA